MIESAKNFIKTYRTFNNRKNLPNIGRFYFYSVILKLIYFAFSNSASCSLSKGLRNLKNAKVTITVIAKATQTATS